MQEQETNKILYIGGKMPCLHCGKTFELDKDIHICEEQYNEPLKWLNKQKSARIGFSDGSMIDLKEMYILHKDGTKTEFESF